MEEWRVVNGYENYEVSNQGRVRVRKTGLVRAVHSDKQGYQVLTMYSGKKKKTLKVHRLVGQAFLGLDFEDRLQVMMHLDDNKANNHVSNLKVGTHKENSEYQIKGTNGVGQLKTGRWYCYVWHEGKRYASSRDTKELALEWQEQKKKELGI